jgi:hypothetical protein
MFGGWFSNSYNKFYFFKKKYLPFSNYSKIQMLLLTEWTSMLSTHQNQKRSLSSLSNLYLYFYTSTFHKNMKILLSSSSSKNTWIWPLTVTWDIKKVTNYGGAYASRAKYFNYNAHYTMYLLQHAEYPSYFTPLSIKKSMYIGFINAIK